MEDVYSKLVKGRGKGEPLYEQIRRHLADQISSGRLTLGDRLPAVSQMAKKWKVDYQTVNSALKQMETDGLIRCEPGRGKGPVIINDTSTKNAIMFVRWSKADFPLEITEGVRQFTEERKLDFSIIDVSHSHADFINAISHPVRGVGGIILVPLDSPDFRKACIHAQGLGIKIVFVDQRLEGLPVSSVSIDHVGGANLATKHLLNLYGQGVYCMGLTQISSVKSRMQGWASAMREYGFHEHDKYIYETDYVDTRLDRHLQIEFENNHKIAAELLKTRIGKRTSIFTCTGSAAQGVYKAAAELGMTIGKDVYVAGFGGGPICRQFKVPLTTVPHNWKDLGYEAANVLMMEMAGAMKHPMYCLLPAKLKIKESSTGKAEKTTDPKHDSDQGKRTAG